MGERKVLNNYIPPDLFEYKIPRRRRPKNPQMTVRMMLPMTLRCAICGEYLGRGTKFNSRKEDAVGEKYLGAIQVFRFYILCSQCFVEITFKTDPRNSDYTVESGAIRSSEPWRAADEAAEQAREGEEVGDAMRALENRSRDAKREMDVAAALEEMQSLRSRRTGVTPEQLLESLDHRRGAACDDGNRRTLEEIEKEDEKLINSIPFHNSKYFVRRIEEEEEDDDDFFGACLARSTKANRHAHTKQRQAIAGSLIVSKKRCTTLEAKGKEQRDQPETSSKAAASTETKARNDALQVLYCSYDDGSDDDES